MHPIKHGEESAVILSKTSVHFCIILYPRDTGTPPDRPISPPIPAHSLEKGKAEQKPPKGKERTAAPTREG